jgi:hypothetical protein
VHPDSPKPFKKLKGNSCIDRLASCKAVQSREIEILAGAISKNRAETLVF